MSTEGGRWSKKSQKLVNVVCERPLSRKCQIVEFSPAGCKISSDFLLKTCQLKGNTYMTLENWHNTRHFKIWQIFEYSFFSKLWFSATLFIIYICWRLYVLMQFNLNCAQFLSARHFVNSNNIKNFLQIC